jgi:hypothetical protein
VQGIDSCCPEVLGRRRELGWGVGGSGAADEQVPRPQPGPGRGRPTAAGAAAGSGEAGRADGGGCSRRIREDDAAHRMAGHPSRRRAGDCLADSGSPRQRPPALLDVRRHGDADGGRRCRRGGAPAARVVTTGDGGGARHAPQRPQRAVDGCGGRAGRLSRHRRARGARGGGLPARPPATTAAPGPRHPDRPSPAARPDARAGSTGGGAN